MLMQLPRNHELWQAVVDIVQGRIQKYRNESWDPEEVKNQERPEPGGQRYIAPGGKVI